MAHTTPLYFSFRIYCLAAIIDRGIVGVIIRIFISVLNSTLMLDYLLEIVGACYVS